MKLQSLTIQKAFIKECIQIKPTMFFYFFLKMKLEHLKLFFFFKLTMVD